MYDAMKTLRRHVRQAPALPSLRHIYAPARWRRHDATESPARLSFFLSSFTTRFITADGMATPTAYATRYRVSFDCRLRPPTPSRPARRRFSPWPYLRRKHGRRRRRSRIAVIISALYGHYYYQHIIHNKIKIHHGPATKNSLSLEH